MMATPKPRIQAKSRRLHRFALQCGGIDLRPYQLEAAKAVLDSIKAGAGRSIVIIFARQSGKDELSANLKTYLLSRFHATEAGIVEVNPTYKPQTINAITRLEDRLDGNIITKLYWQKRSDYMRFFGKATVSFLSGESQAHVVGAVASLLLIVNEAQDIQPAVFDKKFAPMAASTNATRVFMGTAWTSQTLLARELRAAREAEDKDKIRRVFMYTADDVRKTLPAYGQFVDGEIAKLGRQHPLVKTQYFNEELDAQTGMFNASRRALMKGDRTLPIGSAPRVTPMERETYVFTIDVAGQDEACFQIPDQQFLKNPGRDAVTLTIHSVDLSQLETLQAPIYRAIHREQWTGLNHVAVFGKLNALVDVWKPQYIVIDATGVGEGLWAMLEHRYGGSQGKVIPVKFTAQKKSEIGYKFIGMIETSRFRDCADGIPSSQVDEQYTNCVSEVLIGPQKIMRWSVPEGTRNSDGTLIHDDIIVADALITQVDKLDWILTSESQIVQGQDLHEEMERNLLFRLGGFPACPAFYTIIK